MNRAILCLLAGLFVASCHSNVGTFSPGGYKHPDLNYSVRYVEGTKQSLMPNTWQLDNFYTERDTLKAKTGADYEETRYLDVDEDGKRNDLGTVPAFDLRFTSKKNAGVIWIATEPLEIRVKDRELRVLLDSVIDGIGGSGYRVVQLEGQLYATNQTRRYATKIISSGPAKLANQDAYTATVDVSNVDQLKLDPKSVEVRVMFVLARTSFQFQHQLGGDRKFPIVMLCAYSNAPKDFDDGMKDFGDLLSRIQIEASSGYVPAKTETPSAPEQPAAPATSVVDAGAPDAADGS